MAIRELLVDDNVQWYRAYYETVGYKTVYHDADYLLAKEEAEADKAYLYVLETPDNLVIFPSVKKKIHALQGVSLKTEYNDLFTPHEYSGVVAGHFDRKLTEVQDTYPHTGSRQSRTHLLHKGGV